MRYICTVCVLISFNTCTCMYGKLRPCCRLFTATANIKISLCSTYYILSHALKNTANQRPGFTDYCLHILWYAMDNIPLYFPVITCVQQFHGNPFEDFSKASSEILQLLVNHYEHFLSHPEIFEDFPKILKNHKNI